MASDLAGHNAGNRLCTVVEIVARLARESILSMASLPERIPVLNIRVIRVSQGIDSAQGNRARTTLFRSWMHQKFLTSHRAAVWRGHEQVLLKGYALGCPSGSEASQRGRTADASSRPRRRSRVGATRTDDPYHPRPR